MTSTQKDGAGDGKDTNKGTDFNEDRNEKEEGKVFSYLPFEENDVLT